LVFCLLTGGQIKEDFNSNYSQKNTYNTLLVKLPCGDKP